MMMRWEVGGEQRKLTRAQTRRERADPGNREELLGKDVKPSEGGDHEFFTASRAVCISSLCVR